jgi:hypothetical protein
VISDSESDNGSDEQQEENVIIGLGGLSNKCVAKYRLVHKKHFVMCMVILLATCLLAGFC